LSGPLAPQRVECGTPRVPDSARRSRRGGRAREGEKVRCRRQGVEVGDSTSSPTGPVRATGPDENVLVAGRCRFILGGHPGRGDPLAVTPHTVSLLRDSVDGEVITPDRADRYETARPVVAGIADLHPAAIVRPGSVADIQAVIRLAQDTDADLAVRGGGHSSAG